MRTTLLKTWLAVAALSLTVHAHAGSVSLVYTGDNPYNHAGELIASQGDILTFDLIWDFTGTPTVGGSFDVIFNPAALALQSFALANICNDPDCYGGWWGFDVEEDRLANWNYGGFYPIDGVLRMGSVTFEFLSHDHSRSFLHLGPGTGIGGPFISGIDYVSVMHVDFNEILLAPVPVPGAVWLMLGALGGLGVLGARGRAMRAPSTGPA